MFLQAEMNAKPSILSTLTLGIGPSQGRFQLYFQEAPNYIPRGDSIVRESVLPANNTKLKPFIT